MNLRKNVNTDLVGGILGFTVMAMFWGAKKDVGHLSIMFPNALLILIGIFSTILLLKGFVRADRETIFSTGNQWRVFVTALFLLTWVVGIIYAGFLVTSLICFPAMVCYLASARQKISPSKLITWIAISSVEVVIFYFIFSRFLQVPLPTGMFI